MKKKLVLGSILGLVLALAMGAPALAVGIHYHTLCTPGHDHLIAEGLTDNAPHDTAFHNFHDNVHHGQPEVAFANPNNPVQFQPRGGPCP